MFRFFTLSVAMHCGAIIGLLILGFIAPPVKPMPPRMTLNLSPFNRGTPGLPPGDPNPRPKAPDESEGTTPKETPAAEKKAEEPAPTPEATPKPAPTPPVTSKPQVTPMPPKSDKPPIVQPKKKTPPKPEQVVQKKAPPTLKKPIIKKVADTGKKIIVPKKNRKPLEPKHTPTPEPTPEDTPESVVADVTENGESNKALETQTAEFNAPATQAPKAAPTPAGPGGKGTGQKFSSSKALSGAIGFGPAGGGGGNRGNGPGYGYGSILTDLAQTYFAQVLARLEENFKPPYVRPGVECMVQFVIEKSGTISNIQIVKQTGYEGLDHFARQAVEATKLPPLYDGLQMNELPVTITFHYDEKQF